VNAHITLGAAALLGALILATGLVRWAVWPTRQRNLARARSVWPLAPGAVITQAYAWCPVCRMDLPGTVHGTVHGTAYLCPHGHLITTTQGDQ
jgi:hypothetical protein